MRTYTRKRSEYQMIDGVHEMCRLCMEKVKETVPIFSETDSVCASLTMRIMICVGLEITREDCLPDAICTECHKELNNYYEFKKRCLLTYQKLKSHVLAVKQLGTKINAENSLKVYQEENERVRTENRLSNDSPVLNLMESPTLGIGTDVNGLCTISNSVVVEQPLHEPSSYNTPVYQDMSEFLSSILMELGVLSRHGENIMLMDQSINLIEIETGDNNKLVLEMSEMDEEPQNVVSNEVNNELKIEPVTKVVEPTNNNKTVIPPKKESCARCSVCGKRFASRGALRRHGRVHSGERPFSCAQCGRAFAQREVLRRHELVHKEQRPFACTVCAKSFTQRGALVAHARSHAAPAARPLALHRCARCPKVFLHASGLSRHAMVHAGRVFACVSCARQFSDKSSLLRHLRAKHPQPANDAA